MAYSYLIKTTPQEDPFWEEIETQIDPREAMRQTLIEALKIYGLKDCEFDIKVLEIH